MSEYRTTVGIEVHAELKTKAKMAEMESRATDAHV